MGTRTVIFVTGDLPYSDAGQLTIRLYEHWNGAPTRKLAVFRNAIKKANKLLNDYHEWKREAKAIPACGFADSIISETLGVYGFGARIDTDGKEHDKGPETRAIFHEALCPKHYGEQGDLEWVYVVDVNARTLCVYHHGYATVADHIAKGYCNPLDYAEELQPDYRRKHRQIISKLVRSIESLGWRVNPTDSVTKERRLKKSSGALRKQATVPLPGG